MYGPPLLGLELLQLLVQFDKIFIGLAIVGQMSFPPTLVTRMCLLLRSTTDPTPWVATTCLAGIW